MLLGASHRFLGKCNKQIVNLPRNNVDLFYTNTKVLLSAVTTVLFHPWLWIKAKTKKFNLRIHSKTIMYTLSTELLGVAIPSKHCWHKIDQAVHVGSDPLLLAPIVMLEGNTLHHHECWNPIIICNAWIWNCTLTPRINVSPNEQSLHLVVKVIRFNFRVPCHWHIQVRFLPGHRHYSCHHCIYKSYQCLLTNGGWQKWICITHSLWASVTFLSSSRNVSTNLVDFLFNCSHLIASEFAAQLRLQDSAVLSIVSIFMHEIHCTTKYA